jgi:transcription antitermination factor NusG
MFTDATTTTDPCYALRVRSNFEKSVVAQLTGRGYSPFLPAYRTRRQWSDRMREIETPLFPGYVFCRFPLEFRLPVISTPGVLMIAGAGRHPLPVAEHELAAVRRVLEQGWPLEPWQFVEAGDRVVIERGALRGLEGILVEKRGDCRLILSVTLLQRSVAVAIDRDCARPAISPLAPRAHPALDELPHIARVGRHL